MTQETLTSYGEKPVQDIADKPQSDNMLVGASLYETFGFKFNRKIVGTGDIEKNTTFLGTEPVVPGEVVIPERSDFQLFNPDNPYHNYINNVDQEFMFMYGIQIRYYPVKKIVDQKHYNEMYRESTEREFYGAVLQRDSNYTKLVEIEPRVVYGIYESEELNQELTGYGLDTNKACTVYLNIAYINNILQRNPIIGDVVIPFEIPEAVYEVMSVVPVSKTLYIPRRWKLTCKLSQWSL